MISVSSVVNDLCLPSVADRERSDVRVPGIVLELVRRCAGDEWNVQFRPVLPLCSHHRRRASRLRRTARPQISLKPSILSNSEINVLLAIVLVISLIIGSMWAWIELSLSLYLRMPWMKPADEPRATWTRFPEVTALILVALMVGMHLVPRAESTPDASPELTLGRLTTHLIFTGSVALVLPAILICGRSPSVFGFKVQSVGTQILDGVKGFLLALIPTAVLMLATAPLRSRQTQNPLLTLLSDTQDPAVIALIVLAAAVIAPLYEEMMFRVILQGSLGSIVRPRLAVVMTALTFAAIHGAIDGVALVPLALVLGYVFQQRHSYLSVVVIHGLFNGTMLVLALLTRKAI